MSVMQHPNDGMMVQIREDDDDDDSELEEDEEEEEHSDCNTSIIAGLELRERELQEEFRMIKQKEDEIDLKLRESEAARNEREKRIPSSDQIRELNDEEKYMEQEEIELTQQEDELKERHAEVEEELKVLLSKEEQIESHIAELESEEIALEDHKNKFTGANKVLDRLKIKNIKTADKEAIVEERVLYAETLRKEHETKLHNAKKILSEQLTAEEEKLISIKKALFRKTNQLSKGVLVPTDADCEDEDLLEAIGDVSLKQNIHMKLVKRLRSMECVVAERTQSAGNVPKSSPENIKILNEEIQESEEELRTLKNNISNKMYGDEDKLKEEEDQLESEMELLHTQRQELQHLISEQDSKEAKQRKQYNANLRREQQLYAKVSSYLNQLHVELADRESVIQEMEKRVEFFEQKHASELRTTKAATAKKRKSLEKHRKRLAKTQKDSGVTLENEMKTKMRVAHDLTAMQGRLSVQKQKYENQQVRIASERKKLEANKQQATIALREKEAEDKIQDQRVKKQLTQELRDNENQLLQMRESYRKNCSIQRENKDKISKLFEIFGNGDSDSDNEEFNNLHRSRPSLLKDVSPVKATHLLSPPGHRTAARNPSIAFESPVSVLSLQSNSPIDYNRPRVSAGKVDKIESQSVVPSSHESEAIDVDSPIVVQKRKQRPRRSFNLEEFSDIDFSRIESKRKKNSPGSKPAKAPRMSLASNLDLESDEEIFRPLRRSSRPKRSILSAGRNKFISQNVRFDSNVETTRYSVGSVDTAPLDFTIS